MGIRLNDVLLNVDNKPLSTESDLFNYLKSKLQNCLIIRLNNGNLGSGGYKAIRTFNDNVEIAKGVADCLVVHARCIFFVEFKSKTGKQSKEQIEFQGLCSKLDINYLLCNPSNIKAIINIIKLRIGDK